MPFMNETLHPEAEDLTGLIFQQAGQDPEDRCYDAISTIVGGARINGVVYGYRGDEAAADLYSRVAEAGLKEAGKVASVAIVSRCLWENQRAYPNG